jgi:EAL domain-containing protein (putative c-di-GMP-specific phosphodiesterase class I)
LLKSWGCRSAQGFYFAKPMPIEDVTLLRQGKIYRTSRRGHAQTHDSR